MLHSIGSKSVSELLGQAFEDPFATSPDLTAFIREAAQDLNPFSKAIDAGCGEGKPVTAILAETGAEVLGIDISAESIEIAQNQVRKGTFEVADMRTYNPKEPVHAVFAIFSLHQLTPGETYSMLFRFSEWLQPGGVLVIGATPSTSLPEGVGTYDPTWYAVRQYNKPSEDGLRHDLYFPEDRWKTMLHEVGFQVETEKTYEFEPFEMGNDDPERHWLVLARKFEEQPLLGPYPIPLQHVPARIDQKLTVDAAHFVSDEFFELWEDAKRLRHAVYIGPDLNLRGGTIHVLEGAIPHVGSYAKLPFQIGSFKTTVAVFKLDVELNIRDEVRELDKITMHQPGAEVILIQASPDNEALKYLASMPLFPEYSHQGEILRMAQEDLEAYGYRTGFGVLNAHYQFDEEDIDERSIAAAKVLLNLSIPGMNRENNLEQLASRLKIHFQDGSHKIGYNLAVLMARKPPLPA